MGSVMPGSVGSGRRCERHGLAAAPDGLCALCRRESLPPARDPSKWVLGGLLALVLLVSGGTLAYRAATSSSRAGISPEQHTGTVAVATAPVATGMPSTVAVPTAVTTAQQGESIPLSEPLPAPGSLALEAPPAVHAPSAAVPAAPSAAAKVRPPPSQAELQAALAATPITMYATTWCGVCKSARQFMTENGLRYQEIDADQTPGAWDKVQQLIGRRAVPVIVVDGESTGGGLSQQRVMGAVARSMERRLGVTGIRFK